MHLKSIVFTVLSIPYTLSRMFMNGRILAGSGRTPRSILRKMNKSRRNEINNIGAYGHEI